MIVAYQNLFNSIEHILSIIINKQISLIVRPLEANLKHDVDWIYKMVINY